MMAQEQSQEPQSLPENRLAKEKSPYLLQHRRNPVQWYPWGDEAIEAARSQDKLIFLSIGYSTCHWCHVMAYESFENPETAKIMNENFINIKVDREERPDIDKIYMSYTQATSGGGGWPLSVFLTSSLEPVVAGTYFPPKDMYGRPGFPTVLQRVATLWRERREEILAQGKHTLQLLSQALTESPSFQIGIESFTDAPIRLCVQQITAGFDSKLGGFSDAPKFPRPTVMELLFRVIAKEPNSELGKELLEMCSFTLKQMGHGGIFDHLGGGFHRYSVTSDWHIPHFEKMLYDQAQLVISYLTAYQLTQDPFFRQIAIEVMEYVINTITSDEGGIYSAEDADSLLEHGKPEHAEGAFYVWTKAEIDSILGERSPVFCFLFDVREEGNCPPEADPHGELTKKNVLIQRKTLQQASKQYGVSEEQLKQQIAEDKKKLFQVREKRPKPHLDDKIITAWNGLMISAYAKGFQVLEGQKYLNAGKRAAQFIKQHLFDASTRTLIRNYREGPSHVEGFTDDYAFLIQGLLDLYEASAEIEWLQWAVTLQEKQNELFWDDKNGGYFDTTEGAKHLVMRLKDDYDGAEPSSNSVSCLNLLRLSQMIHNAQWKDFAAKSFGYFWKKLSKTPIVLPYMCAAMDFYLSTPKEIVIAGKPQSEQVRALVKVLHERYIPNKVILFADGAEGQAYLSSKASFLQDMKPVQGEASVYICENYSCKLPVSSVEALREQLRSKQAL